MPLKESGSKDSVETSKNTEVDSQSTDDHSSEKNKHDDSATGNLMSENRISSLVDGRRASDFFQSILQKIFPAVASGNITEAFINISDEIKVLLGCESLIIYSVDRSTNQIFPRNFISKNVKDMRLDISNNSLAGFVAKSRLNINVSDAYSSDDLSRYPGLNHDTANDKRFKMKTKAAMVLPIIHENNLIGVLEIINSLRGKSFIYPIPNVAEEFADALALALDKLENEESAEKLRSIGLATQHASVNEENLFELSKPIIDLFNAEMMVLFFVDEPRNEIFTKIKVGANTIVRNLPISNDSIAGWVAMEKKLVNLANVYDADELRNYQPELKHHDRWDLSEGSKTRGMLCCPLTHNNSIVGVLQIITKKETHRFVGSDEKNITALSQILGIAIHNNKIFVKNKPHKFSYLINHGILSANEFDKAASRSREQNIPIENILLYQFHLKRGDIGKSMEEFYGIPYHGFDEQIILPKHFFVGLNLKFLKKNFWVPVRNDDKLVVVIIDDPMDTEKIRNIKLTFPKKEIQFRIGLRADISDFLNSNSIIGDGHTPALDSGEDVSSLLVSLEASRQYEDGIDGIDDIDDEGSISESDNSIVRLVNKIIVDAYDKGVSDIHIEPGSNKNPLLVRYRIEGDCEQIEKIPYNYKYALISRIKIMAKLDIAERRMPQDGKIRMKYGKDVIELRVATCPTIGSNEDVVMRILASSEPIPIDKMNLSKSNDQVLRKGMGKPYGLVLCVGPTGSGKTTTLHSCLGFINTPKRKIWTAEDPVEITQEGLRQVQIHSKIGFDFARAMRTFLRGDPDVIMVGEMRDVETAAIAMEASLTGHLVLSTLHTNSAPETITRLIDMGMNPINFADALLMILAQRLVKTLCVKCKKSYHPTREEFDNLVSEYGEEHFPRLGIKYSDKLMLKKAVGCKDCNSTGYKGRTALHELLEGTETIRRLIMKKAMVNEIRDKAIAEGMSTLKQDGIYKIFKGDCDLLQVSVVCMV